MHSTRIYHLYLDRHAHRPYYHFITHALPPLHGIHIHYSRLHSTASALCLTAQGTFITRIIYFWPPGLSRCRLISPSATPHPGGRHVYPGPYPVACISVPVVH
jgi:hypothetical protein